MTTSMRSNAPAATAALAIAVCLAALPACRREKPNANADLQKSQRELMNDMDKIAAQLEAEEKAKKEQAEKERATPAATPGAPTPEEQPAPAPTPPQPAPGGG